VAGRVVLDLHNIESELQATMASAASGPSRLAYERFRRAYQDAEAHWLPQFDLVLVTSDDDLVRAQRIAPKAKFAVYPNAIPLRTAPSRTPERAFVFSGNLAYAPNITAVEWFAREVWPLARSLNYEWRLVGMNPEAVSSIVGSDARLIGPVEDAVEELAGSQIAIVPLRSGSGTRFKILEAWAACLPVVSTTLGAEGLNARHEEHLLLADTPQQFHQAMKRLVGDPALQARLGAAGRRLYEERFTWPVAWRMLEGLL
jgi:glycosyltransferase involved in cell wall biosynthesis